MRMGSTEKSTGPVRIYRIRGGIRQFSAAFLAFSLLGLLGVLSMHLGIAGRSVGELVGWLGVVLFAVGWAAYVFTASIALLPDAIEQRNLSGTKRLRYEAIRGRSEAVYENADGSRIRTLRVIPEDALQPTLKFQRVYTFDEEFYEWYNLLPEVRE